MLSSDLFFGIKTNTIAIDSQINAIHDRDALGDRMIHWLQILGVSVGKDPRSVWFNGGRLFAKLGWFSPLGYLISSAAISISGFLNLSMYFAKLHLQLRDVFQRTSPSKENPSRWQWLGTMAWKMIIWDPPRKMFQAHVLTIVCGKDIMILNTTDSTTVMGLKVGFWTSKIPQSAGLRAKSSRCVTQLIHLVYKTVIFGCLLYNLPVYWFTY